MCTVHSSTGRETTLYKLGGRGRVLNSMAGRVAVLLVFAYVAMDVICMYDMLRYAYPSFGMIVAQSYQSDRIFQQRQHPVGEKRPDDGQNEGEEDGSAEDLEWTVVTRCSGASAKGNAAKNHGIAHSTESTHENAYSETKQSGECSEKYGQHKECSYFENNPIVVQA